MLPCASFNVLRTRWSAGELYFYIICFDNGQTEGGVFHLVSVSHDTHQQDSPRAESSVHGSGAPARCSCSHSLVASAGGKSARTLLSQAAWWWWLVAKGTPFHQQTHGHRSSGKPPKKNARATNHNDDTQAVRCADKSTFYPSLD